LKKNVHKPTKKTKDGIFFKKKTTKKTKNIKITINKLDKKNIEQ
jgi:hypothetical protein